jgi:hypothetical protein
VNRNLTVALTGGTAGQAQYNPGGVLPEVPAQSWLLFVGILVLLLVLLALPILFRAVSGGIGGLGKMGGGRKKSGRVKLTKLSDVTFTNADPTLPASNAQNVCVWSNTAGRKYTINATGSGGASSAFTLTDGTTSVPYSVQWNSTSGQTSGTALATGVASAAFSSAAVAQDCGGAGGTSASLIVGIAATDLQSMTAGPSYTGTLTLLVSAQ